MSKLIDNYRAVNEGKLSKAEFLRQTRQQYPTYINQFTSFDDAVQIFRNKGILSEEVIYQCPGDKFPLEQIEKGIDVELEAMGLNPMLNPTPADYKKAKMKAIDNLSKDPLFYIKQEACCCDKCKQTQAKAEAKKGVDYKQKKAEGQMQVVKPGQVKVKPLQESAYTDKRESFTEDDKITVQLVQALMKKDNPETGKKYTQAEARKKAAKMIKAKKAKMNEAVDSPIYEAWHNFVGKDDPFEAPQREKEYKEASTVAANIAKKAKPLSAESIAKLKEMPWKAQVAWAKKRVQSLVPTDVEYSHISADDLATMAAVRFLEGYREMSEAVEANTRNEFDKVFRDMWVKYMSDEYWQKLKAAGKAPERKFGPVEAADKALAFVRKNFSPRYTPSRECMASCSARGNQLQYDAKTGKFNLHWNHEVAKKGDMSETKLIRESIEKAVVKVLTEAATANLAKLSDENASIQGVPAILNSLENIVTEIESFILKEQEKIQNVFDQIGNIKNEDSIPIGYKFVEPILNSLKQDLEPVLAKVNLDDLKLPEAPEPDQTELKPTDDVENLAGPGIDDVANAEDAEKAGLYKPNGTKPQPLAEGQDLTNIDDVAKALEGIAIIGYTVNDKHVAELVDGKSIADVNDKLDTIHAPWRAQPVKNEPDRFYIVPFNRYLAESKFNGRAIKVTDNKGKVIFKGRPTHYNRIRKAEDNKMHEYVKALGDKEYTDITGMHIEVLAESRIRRYTK